MGTFILQCLIRSYDEVKHWKLKEVYFKSLLRLLKNVKICGSGEIFYTNEVFILVVQFLLKNAKVLEKVVVTKPLVMRNQTCCIYNVNGTSAFSIVKVPMFNNENKHGKREPSWHCPSTSKFALCGDIEYGHHILLLYRVRVSK